MGSLTKFDGSLVSHDDELPILPSDPSSPTKTVRHVVCPSCTSPKAVVSATHYAVMMCFCPACEHVWDCDAPERNELADSLHSQHLGSVLKNSGSASTPSTRPDTPAPGAGATVTVIQSGITRGDRPAPQTAPTPRLLLAATERLIVIGRCAMPAYGRCHDKHQPRRADP